MQNQHARPPAVQPPSQSYHPVSANLAHQPYPVAPVDAPPVPPRSPQRPEPRPDRVELDPLNGRSPDVRAVITPQVPRRPASVPPVSPSFRAARPPRSPFADELQHLEALADRINQILVERAQFASPLSLSAADSLPASPVMPPRSPQPGSPAPLPLNQTETAALKQQAQRIRQRLAQLEAAMAVAPSPPPLVSDPWGRVEPPSTTIAPASMAPDPPETTLADPPPPSPPPTRPNPFDPMRQQRDYQAWQAVSELHYLQAQDPRSPDSTPLPPSALYSNVPPPAALSTAASPSLRLRRSRPLQSRRSLRSGVSRPLPMWLDAGLWAIVGILLRQLINALAAMLPAWTPILNALLFAPAIFAIVVILLVPQRSQMPFYRLLMVTVGILTGGRLG